MSAIVNLTANPVAIHFEPSKLRMDDDEYFQFCQLTDDPATVSGEPMLKGFALEVRTLWD